MRRCDAFFLLLWLVFAEGAQGAEKEFPCDWENRIWVFRGKVFENGSLLSLEDGNVYPEGSFWALSKKREDFYACPCMLSNCIRICEDDTLGQKIHSVNSKRSKVTIWDENNEHTLVAIEDHFKQVHQKAKCSNPQLLTPEEDERDRFQLLSNGSVYFPPSNFTKVPRMLRPLQFCIIPTVEPDETTRVVICMARARFEYIAFHIDTVKYLHEYTTNIHYFFMTLIVFANFLLVDELKSLHEHAVSSYVICLMTEPSVQNYDEIYLSKIFGFKVSVFYIIGYFTVASMFWLNVICIDIYQTFKRSLARRRKVNFIYPSLYAWGGAALLTCIVWKLDPATRLQNETYKYCWLEKSGCIHLYFYGPVAILLSVNLVLFGLTSRQLWLQRRETQRAFRDATSGRVNARDSDQFKLYLKLFLLMAFTSVNMFFVIISFTFDWIFGEFLRGIVNLVMNLRGPLFFWLFIWSNKYIRKQLILTFYCCRKKPNEVLQMTHQ